MSIGNGFRDYWIGLKRLNEGQKRKNGGHVGKSIRKDIMFGSDIFARAARTGGGA